MPLSTCETLTQEFLDKYETAFLIRRKLFITLIFFYCLSNKGITYKILFSIYN